MSEWSKETVLKTVVQSSVPWVRIPLSPLYNDVIMKKNSKTKKDKDLNHKTYRPKDRYEGFPKDLPYWQRRIFEIIPGFLLWTLLLLPIIFAVFRLTTAYVIYMAFIVAYWFFRAIRFTVGVNIAVKRMEKAIETDWVKKVEELNDDRVEDLRYIYLCPVYGEEYNILDPSFEAWSKSDIGAKKIDVVMAIEEKKQDLQIENFKKLKKKYGDKFGSMQYYIHPAGIPGEIAGVKGANINYATRHFVEKLEQEGKNLRDYLLITCDSDLRPHEKYLSAITYRYMTVENPEYAFFTSAIHTFNNNIWNVPSLIRNSSNMTTMATAYTWVVEKTVKSLFTGEEFYTKDTFSSYIVNLNTLKEMEYWDPEIPNDDTAFYWNTMVRSKGTFKSFEVYTPTYSDAVENKDFVSTHVSFYKQQYRWGWGKIPFPIMLSVILRRGSGISLFKRTQMFKAVTEQMWLFTVVVVLTFGGFLISVLNPDYKHTIFPYNLPRIISYFLTFAMIVNMWTVRARRKITPIPKDWSIWRNILDILETFLLSVNMLTFNLIPHVQAITEMMLGKGKFKRNFYITEKVRKEDISVENS